MALPSSAPTIVGIDHLVRQLFGQEHQIKCVANERGMVFHGVNSQHAWNGVFGVCYVEGSKGNALAGVIYNNQIEFRRHDAFTEQRVRTMMSFVAVEVKKSLDHSLVPVFDGYELVYGATRLGRVDDSAL